ncbi:MAG: S-adenosylmethionine:tRNA ribosyltransferase-isomerase, partial [Candidatus Cloacimonetes bacterium]|nr:S-adenosylmethionine:tRNA ribosyltransferase-isomerase [Candidatus Cloacimonadota bacterium]
NGSVAAPTAGFHFSEQLLESLKARGVTVASVVLHVGIGTFKPVKTENLLEHRMHSEYASIPEETALLINQAKQEGRRVVAVGTTTTRTLESFFSSGQVVPGAKWTSLFLYPGKQFNVVDALITNFHLPKSTLLMLVSAFAGYDFIFSAYREAIQNRYRFFSYGDAMFIH